MRVRFRSPQSAASDCWIRASPARRDYGKLFFTVDRAGRRRQSGHGGLSSDLDCGAMFRGAVLSLTLTILASSVAWSQEPSTREEGDRQRREQRAKEVTPYEPNRVERGLNFAQEKAIFILDREGFHPKFGSLTTGSGFADGLGFRDRDPPPRRIRRGGELVACRRRTRTGETATVMNGHKSTAATASS